MVLENNSRLFCVLQNITVICIVTIQVWCNSLYDGNTKKPLYKTYSGSSLFINPDILIAFFYKEFVLMFRKCKPAFYFKIHVVIQFFKNVKNYNSQTTKKQNVSDYQHNVYKYHKHPLFNCHCNLITMAVQDLYIS